MLYLNEHKMYYILNVFEMSQKSRFVMWRSFYWWWSERFLNRMDGKGVWGWRSCVYCMGLLSFLPDNYRNLVDADSRSTPDLYLMLATRRHTQDGCHMDPVLIWSVSSACIWEFKAATATKVSGAEMSTSISAVIVRNRKMTESNEKKLIEYSRICLMASRWFTFENKRKILNSSNCHLFLALLSEIQNSF